MSTPEYITALREKVGHQQLFLPSVTAVIVRDVPMGASVWEVPSTLLARRADTGDWAPVAGICEPGEDLAATAIREVKEEVGLDARVEALLGAGKVGPVTYANGDECMFMDTTLRLSVDPAAEPVVSDEENLEAGWFSVAHLPRSLSARHRLVIADGVAQLKHPTGFKPRVGYVKRTR
ncbi:DNA mismatch repair protein MutT [Corynebacterium phocae]|uniref:DNA mismatch repair protein MutT n=1 Tax=Corynebacterium phocae TaxID=161895 RepID=A0A1L7D1X9_9CORY|nr:NUDIX domain-containing protein [Corynebacterium phocae]APT92166.1 DNA mismatch repair protein MutT [Corynebacterium phocae]KAA8725953.1 NUDIX domain-containing protein [Corynebacterium phocae]